MFSMWFPHLGNSQVYNYEAISFYNVETNPSVLTSDKKDNIFKLVQKNSLSKNQPFSYTKASYSSHLNSDFFGVGITLNNTDQGKGASYRYHCLVSNSASYINYNNTRNYYSLYS